MFVLYMHVNVYNCVVAMKDILTQPAYQYQPSVNLGKNLVNIHLILHCGALLMEMMKTHNLNVEG